MELFENDRKAFLLLLQIALRARRTEGRYGTLLLKASQALIGDHESIGLTEQEYRSAKDRLKKNGFIKVDRSPQGTIATLIDTSVFDINAESTDVQQSKFSMKNTSQQRSPNSTENSSQPLTTKEEEDLIKTTTPNLFYPGLIDVAFLTEEEKSSLMVFSEERVSLALAWMPPLETLDKPPIHILQWHCRKPIPPAVARPPQDVLIEKYNRCLSDHGYHDLVEKNKTFVEEGGLYVILAGGPTTVTLKQSFTSLKNDLDQSRREIEGKSYER